MIRHTFKLIWNRKRRNFLLISEVFLAFVVMFAVSTAIITGVSRYVKPLGFSYENKWVIYFNRGGLDNEAPEAETRATMVRIQQEMESLPAVNKVSFLSSNYPYSHSSWSTGFDWKDKDYQAWIWLVDDSFDDVMEPTLLEGRWFNSEDDASPRKAIVLTRQMRDDLFGDQSPIGYIQEDDEGKQDKIVVGVVEDYRYKGDFEASRGGFFQRDIISDSASNLAGQAVFSVSDGADARVEEAILKRLESIAPGWNLRIETLQDRRRSYLKGNFLQAGIFVTLAGFLVFNVALGLFGVLWQSISRRHGEIGLRRAIGASRGHIAGQILAESLVLATVAIIAGVVVAIQAPMLGVDAVLKGAPISTLTYALAMASAAVMIYLLVSLCALYPSQLAARVQPAAALHDD